MDRLGFIGLGVMGEPMCRNLARKSGARVTAFDLRTEPLERLAAHGVVAAGSVAQVAAQAEVILLSLPAAVQLEAVCAELLPGEFPERAFPTDYMRKDLAYAMELAQQVGLDLRGAETARDLLEQSSEAGYADVYFPALINVVDR